MRDGQFELYIDKISQMQSKVESEIKYQTVFESGIQLPLMVEGTLITAGNYEDGYISSDELKRAKDLFKGIFIWKSHSYFWDRMKPGVSIPIDAVAGKVLDVSWDEPSKSLKWKGEIDDDNIAFKIVRGLIKSVSVGFVNGVQNIAGKKHKINIEPKELSLVFDPKDPNASITVAK